MTAPLRRFGPALVVVASAGLVGWHALGGLATRLLGHPLNEAYGHVWMQWLVERALARGELPLSHDGIVLGEPVRVLPVDPLDRLLALPLHLVAGPLGAHNLLVLGLLALAGLAVARLARQEGAEPWVGAAAGLFVVLHPALLGYAVDGRVDSLGLGWVALLVGAWLVAVRQPTPRSGLLLGLWAVVVLLAGPNLALASALALSLPTLLALAGRPGRVRPLLVAGLLALPVAAALAAALVVAESGDAGRLAQDTAEEGRRLVQVYSLEELRRARFSEAWEAVAAMCRTLRVAPWWELPEAVTQVWGPHRAAAWLRTEAFSPGAWWGFAVVPWGLAVVGLLRRRRAAAPWVVAAFAFHLLGAGYGPGHALPVKVGDHYAWLAPAVLVGRLPGLGAFNNYGLFSTFSAACCAVAAALGLTGLPRAPLAVALAMVTWGAEVALTSPVAPPLPATESVLDPGLAQAAREAGDGAVLAIPLGKATNDRVQVATGRPGLLRFRFLRTAGPEGSLLADPRGDVERFLLALRDREPTRDEVRGLRERGVDTVVLFPHLLPGDLGEQVARRLEQALGSPVAVGRQGLVFRVP